MAALVGNIVRKPHLAAFCSGVFSDRVLVRFDPGATTDYLFTFDADMLIAVNLVTSVNGVAPKFWPLVWGANAGGWEALGGGYGIGS